MISVQAFDPIFVPIPTDEQEKTVNTILDNLLICTEEEWRSILDEKLNDYVAEIYGFNAEEKSYIKEYVNTYYR